MKRGKRRRCKGRIVEGWRHGGRCSFREWSLGVGYCVMHARQHKAKVPKHTVDSLLGRVSDLLRRAATDDAEELIGELALRLQRRATYSDQA